MARYRLSPDGKPWSVFTPASFPGKHRGVTVVRGPKARADVAVPLMDFLSEHASDSEEHHAEVSRLWDLWERSWTHRDGPKAFGNHVHLSHEAKINGKKVRFWRYRAGSIRVIFFYSGEHVVICTHGYIKKQQETPDSEKRAAKAAYEAYAVEFGE